MSTIEHLESQALTIPERARNLKISTNADYLGACELVKTIKALRAEIASSFEPIRTKAHQAWKEAIRQQDKVEAPLEEGERRVKAVIALWLTEQERLRKQEELRLQQQAQAEEERRQLENAVILDDLGETDEANRLLDEKVEAPAIVLGRFTPQVQGVSMSQRYSAEVTNLMDLVKAVAQGKAPIQCLKADQVFLNRQAVAMRTAMSYPGVRLKKESSVGVRQ